ncbi:HAD family hydrolase [Sneathiella sp. CAU 1612]|uniref:HAD family hydrolase n=1 Tax=Sneathiella sedimenti TaxID=2816034 RepID=A0ABS3F9Z3_9PROT|nr:HAD family hydrolase [Sneathiella sedimenti]MBO0335263.1 HAD family hydrolase [Sneathiella sedimenti]
MSSNSLTVIGFDADDTLWQNEYFFRMTEEKFAALLGDFADSDHITERLIEAERRNLEFYGYGIKGFTLSMIETAIEVTEDKVPASVLHDILRTGREMLRHPVETLPYVRETLMELHGRYRLVMITKGDLFDQERKLAQSGLGDLFDDVQIVSEKNRHTYQRIFSNAGRTPLESMMVGNSLKSDIIPAIEAGSVGVYVPHDLTWVHEHAEAPVDNARFHSIDHLGELPELLAKLS